MFFLSSFEEYVDLARPLRCAMASPTNFVPPFPMMYFADCHGFKDVAAISPQVLLLLLLVTAALMHCICIGTQYDVVEIINYLKGTAAKHDFLTRHCAACDMTCNTAA
jgi:hypothetical protein